MPHSEIYRGTEIPLCPERYTVAGQSAIRLSLSAGDKIRISSFDGCQSAEMIVLNTEGRSQTDAVRVDGCSANETRANGICQQLHGTGRSAKQLASLLTEWRVSKSQIESALSFDGRSSAEIYCLKKATVIIAAAGSDMSVSMQQPVTEIDVTVTRQDKRSTRLPEPLGPVKRDIRVHRATAERYDVKKGDWIQIIDVSGKQCSDFLAFDRHALRHGQEIGLDATATRSVLGVSAPQPGLHSRYLGSDMQSMVEVVQDTVMRHDSFLLACTPRYYDDSGYFGHISCTDNFNRVLANDGIRPRSGWPAINFFFNTRIEPCGTVTMDEPWSRSGDYVLLRATRDLVCASSACPDDIDPANGWSPSDIHVRIYDASCEFPRASAYRLLPSEPPRMTKETGFHSCLSALTKRLFEYRGYWVAAEYEGWGVRAEYLACRERVAMIDLSPLRKFDIVGPDAEEFMQKVLTRNVQRLSIGEIVYSAMCLETGGMIDDGTLFRMGEKGFRWVCGDPGSAIWLRSKAEELGARVSIRDASDQIHNIAVQGPESRNLLRELIWTPESQPSVDKLAWFHFLIGRLGGPEGAPVMVSRTGYTGELGYEIWTHPEHCVGLWQTLWERGEKYGLAPLGFDALDTLRIEAGLIFADHEFCAETNPFEAGIGFTCPMKSKPDDFIGRAAIARQTPESRHRLVGLILDGNEGTAHGEPIYVGRYPIGVVTSATMSPTVGKYIALARVAPDMAEPGTKLEIGKLDGQQKRIGVEVTTLPFYDPERIRVRS